MKAWAVFGFMVLQMFAFAASLRAGALTLSVSSAPTTNLSGYTTDTLTVTDSDPTEKLVGFNFAGPNYGFFGPMNQVNPFGLPTIFSDNNLERLTE
jgi:hypothetical protein